MKRAQAAAIVASYNKDQPERKREPCPALPGYYLRWPHVHYDLFKRENGVAHVLPPWVVRCNAHGTFTQARTGAIGDDLARPNNIGTWCSHH